MSCCSATGRGRGQGFPGESVGKGSTKRVRSWVTAVHDRSGAASFAGSPFPPVPVQHACVHAHPCGPKPAACSNSLGFAHREEKKTQERFAFCGSPCLLIP